MTRNISKKKNVWVINQFAGTPESGWGERHFYFAKYWKDIGYDVKIISGSFNHMFKNTVKVESLYKHDVYDGIDFFWVKTPAYKPQSIMRFFSMLIFMLRVLRLPVNILGLPDTVIVSSMPIFSIYSGIQLKRKYNSKLLFEIRDIWPLTLQMLGNKSANHPAVRFLGWFEKIGYKKSDCIVSLLPNSRAHIESVAGKKVDFQYIPNGIDENLLKSEELPEKFDEKIPEDKFVIGYAGTIGLANALEYLVEAAIMLEKDPRFFFVIVGDGYLKKDLEKIAKNSTNILFIPKIKKSQVQNVLKIFDACFVGRSDSDLYKHGVSANKYFDYMLACKPILDSNNFIKDPVEMSGCGIIVKPESANDIVNGILKLKSMSNAERFEMGKKGLKYIKENHDISKLAFQYSSLF
jgi:glycosyltransferase involved in cell wall biosynthesis